MRKYYFVFPVIYLAIALIFLINYISSWREVKYNWGGLSLSVQLSDKNIREQMSDSSVLPAGGIEIQRAAIKFGKINFVFNSSSDITENKLNLTLSKVVPLSNNDGFSLIFTPRDKKASQESKDVTNVVVLSFQSNIIFKQELALSVRSAKSARILLPFKTSLGVRIKDENANTDNKGQNLSLISPRGKDIFKMLGQSYFVKLQNTWAIQGNESYFVTRYSPNNEGGFVSIKKTPQMSPSIQKQSRAEVKKYIDVMYEGLIKTRYDDSLGLWLLPEGVSGFSEDALAVSFAESAIRKEFSKYKLFLDRAAYLHKEARSWRTAAIVSEDSQFMNFFINSVKEEQIQIQNSISEQNYSILKDLFLFEKAFAFFDIKTQNMLIEFIKNIPSQRLEVEIAASLLFQNKKQVWTDITQAIDEMEGVLLRILTDNIVVANNGYMVKRSSDEIDVKLSVLVGRYLSLYAQDVQTQRLGSRIIMTSLHSFNKLGFLPRVFILKKKNIQPLGFLAPEEIYFILKNNKYYPQITSFNFFKDTPNTKENNFEQKFAVLSVAPVSVSYGDKQVHVDIDVVQKETTQFAYILKAPQPRLITGFDVVWQGRSFVPSVSQGVYYDKQTDVILIKISSQKNKERITLLY